MAKDKKVWIWIVGIVALAFLLFNILPSKSDNGLISVNLYDNSGNLMAIVNGQAGVSEIGYTLNVVNTGDQALDMTVTLTGSSTAYNSFSSVPGCSSVTNGMQCLFSLSTGQTKVLTGTRIDADSIAPSTLTLDAVAQGSFDYFGNTQTIQQGDSSTVVIQSESVVIRGCTDSNAANYDPQATEDDGSCLYQTCRNGVREGTEVCDNGQLGGQTCQTQGYSGGSLNCNSGCNGYDTSNCYRYTCGNGVIEYPELCDGSVFAQPSSGDCQTYYPNQNPPWDGPVTCSSGCMSADANSCRN